MKEKIIQNYINNLSPSDIKFFTIEHNIVLTDQEINYLYKLAKKEWKTFIFGNPNNIFNQLKTVFNTDKYNQLYQLYQTYKNKYSHYL